MNCEPRTSDSGGLMATLHLYQYSAFGISQLCIDFGKSTRKLALLCFASGLFAYSQVASIPNQLNMAFNSLQPLEYFRHRRAYAFKHATSGARLKAFRQMNQML